MISPAAFSYSFVGMHILRELQLLTHVQQTGSIVKY